MATTVPAPADPSPTKKQNRKLIRIKETIIEWVLFLCGLLSIVITGAIAVVLITGTINFFLYEEQPDPNIAVVKTNAQAISKSAAKLSVALKKSRIDDVDARKIVLDADTIRRAVTETPPNVQRMSSAASEIHNAATRITKRSEAKNINADCADIIRRSNVIDAEAGKKGMLVMSGAAIWERITYFFTGADWSAGFDNPKYGIAPLVLGTLMVAVIAALIAVPIGLATAIYLSEYARPRVRAVAKPTLELLAGIPTVVYGFFAITAVTPFLAQWIPGLGNPNNQLAGGIVVGIMIIPMVASLSEDALRAVPSSLRHGSIALGANKFETSVKVVLPAALSGVVASFLLAVSRAVGETMAVSLACGDTPQLTLDPRKGLGTMTSFIVRAAKGDVEHGSTYYNSLFAVAGLLFFMTLMMNILAQKVLRRFRQVYQ